MSVDFDYHRTQWFPCFNGGDTIAANSIVRILDSTISSTNRINVLPAKPESAQVPLLEIGLPNSNVTPFFGVTGVTIDRNQQGFVALDGIVSVRYESDFPLTGFPKACGPKVGSYKASHQSSGLVAINRYDHLIDMSSKEQMLLCKFTSARLKPFCRWQPTTAFTTSTSTVPGYVIEAYGDGFDHYLDYGVFTTGTFYNPAGTTSTYIFEGTTAGRGLAEYMGYGGNWKIKQFVCP